MRLGNIFYTANKGVVSGYANVYVATVAARIQKGEKTRIYGKGAEMYKIIKYKKVHNTGN